MRSEHGSHLRTECLAAAALLTAALLLCGASAPAARPPFAPAARQCLSLDGGEAADGAACGDGDVRLRFCDAYAPRRLLADGDCGAPALARLRTADARAREAAALFRALVDRYDCETTNSVSWTCKDCEEAYKQWVCAMHLPELRGGAVAGEESVKPCRHICRLVEQRCPYFHPSVKDQYAGERVFKCIDPDIPDLDVIQNLTSYGPPHRCYCPQHLGAEPSGDPECSPPARRTGGPRHGRGGHRSGGAPGRPPTLLLPAALLTLLLHHRWTRAR